jgi:hypothetical protein
MCYVCCLVDEAVVGVMSKVAHAPPYPRSAPIGYFYLSGDAVLMCSASEELPEGRIEAVGLEEGSSKE